MKMKMNRREALRLLTGAGATLALSPLPALSDDKPGKRLGVCSISYALRWPAVNRGRGTIEEVLEFIEHCRVLEAGGVQTAILPEKDFTTRVRAKMEGAGMYLEGQVALPKAEADLDRFEASIRAAKEAGASVVRTACLGGRRYEMFKDAEAFAEFAKQSEQSLLWAEPIVRKHRVQLAIENHKDWQVPELLALMRLLSSEYVGICVDTGNSIALLEDPGAVVEAYAPYAMATHLKDMAVQEYEQGFLLSEVPLGEGFLDLPSLVGTLRRVKPDLRFSLEMIARDPLQIPCLAEPYWGTFDHVPGWFLAGTLSMVRKHAAKQPLPKLSGLSDKEKLESEDRAVRRSLAYARAKLSL